MFDIGKRIREIRKLNNMTMVDLASKINITQAQLSRLENNINMAQFDTICKVCDVFNISLSDFFDDGSKAIPMSDDIKELIDIAKTLNPEKLRALKMTAKAMER